MSHLPRNTCTLGYCHLLQCPLMSHTLIFDNCKLPEVERISDQLDVSQSGTHARLLPSGARVPWEWGFSFHRLTLRSFIHADFTVLALPCEHSQANKTKEAPWDTHLILKSSAASLALSISSMMRAFSSVLFLTLAKWEVR